MSQRCLVTGAAGLIGFEVARQLALEGHAVVAVDNGSKGGLADLERLAQEQARRVELVQADLAGAFELPAGATTRSSISPRSWACAT